jgi:hypothetical protein
MRIDSDNPLGAEIRREMAEAYFGACKKMVDSLEALKAFDRAVSSPTLGNEQITRRTDLLEAAGERVYFVIIQREAMELSCLDGFFESYDIPDDVRSRLRPRQEK